MCSKSLVCVEGGILVKCCVDVGGKMFYESSYWRYKKEVGFCSLWPWAKLPLFSPYLFCFFGDLLVMHLLFIHFFFFLFFHNVKCLFLFYWRKLIINCKMHCKLVLWWFQVSAFILITSFFTRSPFYCFSSFFLTLFITNKPVSYCRFCMHSFMQTHFPFLTLLSYYLLFYFLSNLFYSNICSTRNGRNAGWLGTCVWSVDLKYAVTFQRSNWWFYC